MCLDQNQNELMGWRRLPCFSPAVIFYLQLQGGASVVDHIYYLCITFVFIIVSCCLVCSLQPLITCLGRADFLALLCVMFPCFLSLSHMVSRVRCGT